MRAYLQSEMRAWLSAEPGRTGQDLARLAGLTGAQISTVKNHGRGAGWETVEGMAQVLGISTDDLKRRALEAWSTQSHEPPNLRLVRDESSLANAEMPGWEEAEKIARIRSGLPDWTFKRARKRTGLVPRDGVTPQFVIDEAASVLRYSSPDEVIEETNKELDRQIEAEHKRAKAPKKSGPKKSR